MARERVKCPHCGQPAPVEFEPPSAMSKGIFIKCKGRHCGQVFEVTIKDGRQVATPMRAVKKM